MSENTGGGLDPRKINDDLIPTRSTIWFRFCNKTLERLIS